jgi:hypothetical protein
MAASISVIGVQDGMGGLKESQAKFRKHHGEVGDALLNISGVGTATGAAVDKDEPRPGYQHQEFPKMLYKPNEEVIVTNKADMDAHLRAGWRDEPYLKPQVAVLDPATEKKALMETNAQQQAQLTVQNEMIQKLQARLEALENAATDPKRK